MIMMELCMCTLVLSAVAKVASVKISDKQIIQWLRNLLSAIHSFYHMSE